jgi:hypothetical protein
MRKSSSDLAAITALRRSGVSRADAEKQVEARMAARLANRLARRPKPKPRPARPTTGEEKAVRLALCREPCEELRQINSLPCCAAADLGCINSATEKFAGRLASAQAVCPRGIWPKLHYFPEITRRNLIYHVYAHPGNAAWSANLRQVKRRLPLFNGRRLVSILTAPELVPPAEVRAVLGDAVEYLEVPNDPRLREVASFPRLLEAVASTAGDEATFYAHAKGSSDGVEHVSKNARGVEYWRNAMYHHCLDDWPKVALALRDFPIAGCFKIDWTNWTKGVDPFYHFNPSGLVRGSWMFAGTFFWFRHDQTFGHPRWRFVADDSYGSEAWPATLWGPEYGHSLYQPWPSTRQPNPDLYDVRTHAERIEDD